MSESESFWADIELLDPNNQVMASPLIIFRYPGGT